MAGTVVRAGWAAAEAALRLSPPAVRIAAAVLNGALEAAKPGSADYVKTRYRLAQVYLAYTNDLAVAARHLQMAMAITKTLPEAEAHLRYEVIDLYVHALQRQNEASLATNFLRSTLAEATSRSHGPWIYHFSLRLVAVLTATVPPAPPEDWAAALDSALAHAAAVGDTNAKARLLTAKMRALVATGGYEAAPAALDLFRQARALFSDSATADAAAPHALLPVKSNAYVQFAIPAVAALLTLGDVREAQSVLDVLVELLKSENTAPLPALPGDYIAIADAHKVAAVYLLAGLCRQKSAADQARQFLTLGIACTDRILDDTRPWMQPDAFPTVRLFIDLRELLLGNLCLACLATGDAKAALDALRQCASPLQLPTGEVLAEVHPAQHTDLQCLAALMEQQVGQPERAVQRWQVLIRRPMSPDLRSLAGLHLLQLTLAKGAHQAAAQTALLELERTERQHAAEDPRYRLAHLALRGAQAFVMNDLPKTKEFLLEVLRGIREGAADSQTKVFPLLILGAVYGMLNDAQAEQMLMSAYAIAKKLGSHPLCLHSTKQLLDLYRQNHQIDKAGSSLTLVATHSQFLAAQAAVRPDLTAIVPLPTAGT